MILILLVIAWYFDGSFSSLSFCNRYVLLVFILFGWFVTFLQSFRFLSASLGCVLDRGSSYVVNFIKGFSLFLVKSDKVTCMVAGSQFFFSLLLLIFLACVPLCFILSWILITYWITEWFLGKLCYCTLVWHCRSGKLWLCSF